MNLFSDNGNQFFSVPTGAVASRGNILLFKVNNRLFNRLLLKASHGFASTSTAAVRAGLDDLTPMKVVQ